MADDRNLKPKKQRGGWIEIDEPVSVGQEEKPAILAGTSASQIPKTLSVSCDSIHDVFTSTIGAYLWRQFNENEIDLNGEQRQAILGSILDPVSIDGVRSLLSELYKRDEKGWTLAGTFPALIRICQDYLKAHGSAAVEPPPDPRTQELLARLNAKRAGV